MVMVTASEETETASGENEALNQPLNNGESSCMDMETEIIPRGSAVPVPTSVIGGKETEAGGSAVPVPTSVIGGKETEAGGSAVPIPSIGGNETSTSTSTVKNIPLKFSFPPIDITDYMSESTSAESESSRDESESSTDESENASEQEGIIDHEIHTAINARPTSESLLGLGPVSSSSEEESRYTLCNKKPRLMGRGIGTWQPLGSRKFPKKLTAGGVSLEKLTSYMLLVQKGEDVIQKLDEFLRIVQGTVCVISAVGLVSSAYILSSTSNSKDGVIRYEGKIDLLSMSGSHSYNKKTRCISGTLSATLSISGTQAFGGFLKDVLIASGEVEVVIGIFKNKVQYIQNHLGMVRGKTPLTKQNEESSSDDAVYAN